VAWPRKIDIDDFLDCGGSRTHHEDAIGQLDGFLDIVRDKKDCFLLALPDAHKIGAHFQAGQKIERAERFVHINEVRVGRECACDLNPLTHSTGKLVRVRVFKTGQTYHLDVARDNALALALLLLAQTKADVLAYVQPRENAVLLENENASRIGAAHGLALDQHFAKSRIDKSSHDVEQSGFSATARADQANEFAVRDLRIHFFQNIDDDRSDIVSGATATFSMSAVFPNSRSIRLRRAASTWQGIYVLRE